MEQYPANFSSDTSLDDLPYISEKHKEHNPIKVLRPISGGHLLNGKRKIYKFLSFDSFRLTLKSGLQFSEPKIWPDKFERRFYNADYSLLGNLKEKLPRQVYACCMALEGYSESAWKNYVGTGEICVRITINRNKFLKALKQWVKTNTEYTGYEGKVLYRPRFIIANVHKRNIQATRNIYAAVFGKSQFSLDDFLSLLLLKRVDFEHEKEVRYFLVPETEEKNLLHNKLYVEFTDSEWNDIIEQIVLVDPCNSNGISYKVFEECRNKILCEFPYLMEDKIVCYDPYDDDVNIVILP